MTKERKDARRRQERASVEGVSNRPRSHGIAESQQALSLPIPQDETETSAQLGPAFDAALPIGFGDAPLRSVFPVEPPVESHHAVFGDPDRRVMAR
jgi:hypothetical protein